MAVFVPLPDLQAYLDDYLDSVGFPDYKGAVNGLQVEGDRPISTIAVAVDACRFTIDEAINRKADLLIVHHGLFWNATVPLTGAAYKRIAPLIKSGTALYSSHLPLDAHPEVGNNAVLAQKLQMRAVSAFGKYEGREIGLIAETGMVFDEVVVRLEEVLGDRPQYYRTGPDKIVRAAIVTGGGASFLADAQGAGCDTLITGEASHHHFFEAEERGMNLFLGGHYLTETLGVKALALHLERQFMLDTIFIDHPSGL